MLDGGHLANLALSWESHCRQDGRGESARGGDESPNPHWNSSHRDKMTALLEPHCVLNDLLVS